MSAPAKRVTKKKLAAGAELAKSKNVRVRIGDYVIEPIDGDVVVRSNDAGADQDEGHELEARMKTKMGAARK